MARDGFSDDGGRGIEVFRDPLDGLWPCYEVALNPLDEGEFSREFLDRFDIDLADSRTESLKEER